MRVTILWNLQLSAVDKKTKKFLVNKDSNYSVCINTIKALNHKSVNIKFRHLVLVPHLAKVEKVKNVEYIVSKNYITDVFSSRYNWNYNLFEKIVLERKIDVIWENNPTLVANWKTLLLSNGLIDKIKVIAYNHWIDTERYPKIDRRCPYSIRQGEGVILSDLFLCNSREAARQCRSTMNYINSRKYKFRDKFIHKLPPIQIEDEFIYKRPERIFVRIIYNHRLSSMVYYKNAYDLFVEAVNFVSSKFAHPDVVVSFTDASGKISDSQELEKDFDNDIVVELHSNLERKEYIDLLYNSDICAATFFSNGGCWSISLAEAILSGNAVLVPNHAGYKEMVSKNFTGLITKDYRTIGKKILQLVNNPILRLRNSVEAKKYFIKNYSYIKMAKRLEKLISEIL